MKARPLVIIPAYNEEETIEEVVRRTLPHGDVCVVNDGSKDRTRQIVESIEGVTCINHVVNTHIPGAVLDGMKHAVAHDYPAAIAMDAGLSHDPAAIPAFVAAAAQGYDVVIGRRVAKHDTPLYRKLLSVSGNALYNYALDPSLVVLPRAWYPDVTSGYRLYSRRCIELLLARRFEARSFDFIIEALMYAHRNGLRIGSVPIEYRFTGSSLNRKVVKDALRMLRLMVFSRRR